MTLLTRLVNVIDNEYAALAADGIAAGDVSGWIDTGSYAFNALLSGSVYGGLPSNKITALAGESSTGKTFFALGIIKNFLNDNPKGVVLLYESESAITKQMMEERGLDTTRIVVIPVVTVEEFKTQCLRAVNTYLDADKADKIPLLICLDSLGMLSTEKEMEDSHTGPNKLGKYVKDMTRSQITKAAFRVLTLKLGKANIPLIITNHVYAVIGQMYADSEMSGGSGLKYASSGTIFLTRSKARGEDVGQGAAAKNVVGSLISCTAKKSRLTKEGSRVKVMLTHDKGLSRYYGLFDIAVQADVFVKSGKKIQLPSGDSVFRKDILAHPEKYYTKEVLDLIDAWTMKNFTYANLTEDEVIDHLVETETETGCESDEV